MRMNMECESGRDMNLFGGFTSHESWMIITENVSWMVFLTMIRQITGPRPFVEKIESWICSREGFLDESAQVKRPCALDAANHGSNDYIKYAFILVSRAE
jgi:hypothetical protein